MLLKVSLFVVGAWEISPAGLSHSEENIFPPQHDTSEVILGTGMFCCPQQQLLALLVLRANKLVVMTKYRTTRSGLIKDEVCGRWPVQGAQPVSKVTTVATPTMPFCQSISARVLARLSLAQWLHFLSALHKPWSDFCIMDGYGETTDTTSKTPQTSLPFRKPPRISSIISENLHFASRSGEDKRAKVLAFKRPVLYFRV